MDLRHLRYFVAVAQQAHFGRAAESLHIVQPALSMQIKALEDEVGGALFVRTSRKVELTEAGALLLVEARRTLAQAGRAKDIVQQSLRGEIGTVTVGFSGNAVLTGTLTDDLRNFHRHYPQVKLELVEMQPLLQGDAILDGSIDISYTPGAGLRFDARLVVEKKGRWPMVVAMASDHRLAKVKRLSIKALAGEPLIVYAAGDGDQRLEVLRQHMGSGINVAHRVSTTLSALALAAAGLGVALVPAPLDQVHLGNLVYHPLAEKSLVADLVLLSRAHETRGAVQAFLALARGAPVQPLPGSR